MQTIIAHGQIMSGKNILWKLLDGHSKIIVNHVHTTFTMHFLKKNVQDYYLKKKNSIQESVIKKLNFITLKITDNISIDLLIGDYFDSLYRFTSYKNFFSLSKNNLIVTNSKELDFEFNEWNFNILKFEELVSTKIFSKKRVLDFQQFVEEMQIIYCIAAGKNHKNISYFVESIDNDNDNFELLEKYFKEFKIICLKRNNIDLLYANFRRSKMFMHKGSYLKYFISNKYLDLFKYINQYFFFKKRVINFHKSLLHISSKNILEIKFEDLILNTKNSMKEICNFLKLEIEDIVLFPSQNGKTLPKASNTLGIINDSAKNYFNKDEILFFKKFSSNFYLNYFNFRIILVISFVSFYIKQQFKFLFKKLL